MAAAVLDLGDKAGLPGLTLGVEWRSVPSKTSKERGQLFLDDVRQATECRLSVILLLDKYSEFGCFNLDLYFRFKQVFVVLVTCM